MKLFNNQTSKLGKHIWSFNLSRESCLYKTKLCDKYCYGKRGNHLFHESAYLGNLKISRENIFVELANMELDEINKKYKGKYVRIHGLGDFYSQDYFNRWVIIAKVNTNIQFLAYTRNYEIDCSQRPKNLKVYYSMDKSTEQTNKTVDGYAYVVGKNDTSKISGRNCSVGCNHCKYCFNTGNNVIFRQH